MTLEEFRIDWCHEAMGDGTGNNYGYTVHNKTLKRYCENLIQMDPAAEDSLVILPPEGYQAKPGKVNWLFTMFEGEDIPEPYSRYLVNADYILTPSTWVRNLFSRVYPRDRIFVVNHGVEPFFTYKARKWPLPKKPFRFLWVGAPNPRKGWQELVYMWKNAGLENFPQLELYLKTTNLPKPPGGKEYHVNKNVIVDGRNLPRKDLLKLYHDSHAFLFPTRGEGFGLTLAEAMRTGLPCISPSYSGVADFFDEDVGYEVSYTIQQSTVSFVGRPDLGDHATRVAFPNMEEIVERIHEICNSRGAYKKALVKGRRAYNRMLGFTWDRSAETMVGIMFDEFKKRRARDAA